MIAYISSCITELRCTKTPNKKYEQNESCVCGSTFKKKHNEEGNKFCIKITTNCNYFVLFFSHFVLINHESRTNKFLSFEPKERRSLLRAAQLPVSLYN